MKIYRLLPGSAALLFDMDSTLYTHPEYARAQVDPLIKRFGQKRGKDFPEARREIEDFRQNWAASHGGQNLSLGFIFAAHGITMEENIRWREESCEPGLYLKADPVLRDTLALLGSSFALAVVTNNPVSTARKTLDVLGVADLFAVVVGLDTCRVSKPHKAPFLKAAEDLGLSPKICVSVGDRYDVDLAPPLELGMGGILVEGVGDVYKLPEVLGLKAR
ncbi:MAG: HAD family hydrolase [Treponema sp.]|jgi:phosphoglycolate phosphatase/putative hydrolase of the HAD superfamily|nr:HAD family hydrolase [Treponema sp.]